MANRNISLSEQFAKFAVLDPDTDCVIWTGYKLPGGHGQVSRHGRMRLAHRVAYEHWIGPIPAGMNVNHQCDVPACVNPDHLQIGTQAENVREAIERGQFHRTRKQVNRHR